MAFWSAASASPSLRHTLPGAETSFSICARRVALVSAVLGPWSHSTPRASRPLVAAHVLRATTATPPGAKAPSGPVGGISTTCLTPGTAFAFAMSNFAGLPPKVGQRAMTA